MQNELFSQLQPRPDDPILGLNELFQKDERPEKVNLTVGAYLTDAGVMPLLPTVEEATKRVLARREPHAYIPMSGLPAYNEGVRRLLFGAERAPALSERTATVQTIGGTGALYLAALFAKNVLGVKLVVVSDPTWGNHIAIFKLAGLEVATYPYYNRTLGGLRFDGMRSALSTLPANTMVLIHACCHNPTGVDLPKDAWSEIVKIVKERNLVPLLDIAYQGLGDGLDEDGYAPRLFADEGVATLVAASSSKNFALYGQRAGALHVLKAHGRIDPEEPRSLLVLESAEVRGLRRRGSPRRPRTRSPLAQGGRRNARAHGAHAPALCRSGRTPRRGPLVCRRTKGDVLLHGLKRGCSPSRASRRK